MQTDTPKTKLRLSPFTLLAVTALAVSNLMVGLLQGNTFLILASSLISIAFALVYAARSGMIPSNWLDQFWPTPNKSETAEPSPNRPKSHFPLWMFLAVIFVLMPAILLFLQSVET
ncbi:MAG: hypothetical protein AAF996_07995 [Pseudomonadota bacterium]